MRVIIFAGKLEDDIEYMKPILKPNDYIIACDGGLGTVHRLNLKPDLLIGDFDSVEYQLLDIYSDVKKMEYDIEKDFSDLELTFEHCLELETSEIIVFGATGGRSDQAIANIGLLNLYYTKGLDIKYFDNNNEMFITDKSIAVKKSKHYFSIIAMEDDTVISLDGTKYKLDNASINRYTTRTISNEIDGSFAYVNVHKGRVLVMQVDMM